MNVEQGLPTKEKKETKTRQYKIKQKDMKKLMAFPQTDKFVVFIILSYDKESK